MYYFFKHISHVDSWYIMYDCVHQLCNAIQAMAMYYLFDSQSPTLFNQKLFLPLLLSPNSFLSFVGLSSTSPHPCVMFLHWTYSALMLQEGVTSVCQPGPKRQLSKSCKEMIKQGQKQFVKCFKTSISK